MKKTLWTLMTIVIFFILPAIVGGIENRYSMEGWILSGGCVEDITGNVWGYDTDIPTGTKVKILFDNMGTPDRKDDIIYKICIEKG